MLELFRGSGDNGAVPICAAVRGPGRDIRETAVSEYKPAFITY